MILFLLLCNKSKYCSILGQNYNGDQGYKYQNSVLSHNSCSSTQKCSFYHQFSRATNMQYNYLYNNRAHISIQDKPRFSSCLSIAVSYPVLYYVQLVQNLLIYLIQKEVETLEMPRKVKFMSYVHGPINSISPHKTHNRNLKITNTNQGQLLCQDRSK